MLARMWRKGNPCALLVGMQIGAATVETSTEITQKIKNGSAFWSSDATSGYITEETQNTNSKEYLHPCVHCSIIYNSQDIEATQVPKVVIHTRARAHTHQNITKHKKNEILPFTMAWMDLESLMLSEISQGRTNTIWFHLYMESKKQNKWTNKIETDSQLQRSVWRDWGWGTGWKKWRG